MNAASVFSNRLQLACQGIETQIGEEVVQNYIVLLQQNRFS